MGPLHYDRRMSQSDKRHRGPFEQQHGEIGNSCM